MRPDGHRSSAETVAAIFGTDQRQLGLRRRLRRRRRRRSPGDHPCPSKLLPPPPSPPPLETLTPYSRLAARVGRRHGTAVELQRGRRRVAAGAALAVVFSLGKFSIRPYLETPHFCLSHLAARAAGAQHLDAGGGEVRDRNVGVGDGCRGIAGRSGLAADARMGVTRVCCLSCYRTPRRRPRHRRRCWQR